MISSPGPESIIGLDRWSPELRRAVIVARPEFFAWSAEDQLRYRVKLPHDDREAIDPKVVPLRKKLKVMLHPEALRDLEDDGLL